MANLKSAKKQAKKALSRRTINAARKTSIKTATKKVVSAIEEGSADRAKELLREVEAKLSRAQGKNLLHKNTVARKVSRLAKKIARMAKEPQAAA